MKELKGLTSKEVKELQEKYGKNELSLEKHKPFIFKIFEILCEPMFTLLIIAFFFTVTFFFFCVYVYIFVFA